MQDLGRVLEGKDFLKIEKQQQWQVEAEFTRWSKWGDNPGPGFLRKEIINTDERGG